jgi:hypothetical protein
MKTINKIILIIFIQFLSRGAEAQGFVNLNFESANVSGFSTGSVPTTNTFPSWTAYIAGVQQSSVIYDTRPLDNAAVTLQGTNSDSLTPIQGNFTAWLLGSSRFASQQQSVGLGQTGQVPVSAESLIFWGYVGSTDVSFAGHTLSLIEIGNTANYNIYGANISSYAGQTGQLLFTVQPGFNDVIDNIQFSSNIVPEPSTLGLSALGGLFVVWRRWRKFS